MNQSTYSQIVTYTIKLLKNKGLRVRFHQAFYEQSAGAFPEVYIVDQPLNLTKSELEPILSHLNFGTKKRLNSNGDLVDAPHLGFDFWIGFDVKPQLFDDQPDSLKGGKLFNVTEDI